VPLELTPDGWRAARRAARLPARRRARFESEHGLSAMTRACSPSRARWTSSTRHGCTAAPRPSPTALRDAGAAEESGRELEQTALAAALAALLSRVDARA
jgi:hypothetical protein